jgi:hypothetical protein
MGDPGPERGVTGPAATPRWMRPVRAGLVAAGGGLMLYAVLGAVTDRSDRIGGHLIFLVAVLVGHDWLLMPLAIAIGALLARTVPSRARAETTAAAYVSGVLLVVALPLVLGLGRTPDEPSALPLNYGRGLLTSVAVVWFAAGATFLYRRWRRPARSPTGQPSRR